MSQSKELLDRLERIRDNCITENESLTIMFHGDGSISAFLDDNDSEEPDVHASDLEDLVDELESILEL